MQKFRSREFSAARFLVSSFLISLITYFTRMGMNVIVILLIYASRGWKINELITSGPDDQAHVSISCIIIIQGS